MAVVSGQDDFDDDRVRSLLPAQAASFVEAIRAKNEGFLTEFAKTADAEGFMRLVLSLSSAKDRELYGAEPFNSAYLRCLVEGFSRGPQGYISDLVLALGRWPFDLKRISIPVDLWYGELDQNPTHSPDFGETLARKIPLSTHHLLKNEGGSLLWTKSREILAALTRPISSES